MRLKRIAREGTAGICMGSGPWNCEKVTPYILVGVGIGAVIHNWIPESFIVKVLGEETRSESSLLPLWGFRCTLIFSGLFRLLRRFWERC